MQNRKVEVKNLGNKIKRLYNLLSVDEGFYSLALHSLAENIINQSCDGAKDIYNFPDKLEMYRDYLLTDPPQQRNWRHILGNIKRDRDNTNGVRHNFERISGEEAMAMTYNFLNFCYISGFKELQELNLIKENIEKAWDEKIAPIEQREELKSAQFKLMMSQRQNKKYEEEIDELKALERGNAQLKNELDAVKRQLEDKTTLAEMRDSKIDELRQKKRNLEDQLKESQKKAQELEPVREHLSYLERLSNYSRTRRDYERSIIKLTPEQNDVLNKIKLNHDYLVKGSAGTGKTLVLLKALAKAFEQGSQELGFEESAAQRIVLLTYTNTLVRYNQYLSDIMQEANVNSVIMTSDSLFRRTLKRIDPSYDVNYDVMDDLIAQYNSTDFFSNRELYTEIEDFIFAGAISEEEYIDKRIPRKGLKLPLNNKQRTVVWNITKQLVADMESRGEFSKNYSRLKILAYLQQHPEDADIRDISFVFLDEAQDLAAVELMTLKTLANRPLIMAGDVDQSIYGFSSPYARAGIELPGYTKILRLNFRNTAAIHQFSEYYRSVSDEIEYDDTQDSEAFREGPIPELVLYDDKRILFNSLIKRAIIFIEHLGYDPENLAILAPTKKDLKRFQSELENKGYESGIIVEREFDFAQENIIRLSTLHSSKGVDFPVVLIYLPYMPPMKDVDEVTLNKMYHNLVYVACTRAMDHLVIATKDESEHEAISDLKLAYEKLEQEFEKYDI